MVRGLAGASTLPLVNVSHADGGTTLMTCVMHAVGIDKWCSKHRVLGDITVDVQGGEILAI